MDVDALRALCLAKAGASEGYPYGPGALVMKVAGKVFAIIADAAEPPTISLKCEPEIAVAMRESYDAVIPGYHLNKKHWNTVVADGSVDDQLADWIDDSYDLVVAGLPRRVREQLAPS